MIDLHYVATSNGLKAAIALEEMALPYQMITYDLFSGEHLLPDFKNINPNHKLPVIVDHAVGDGGAPLPVFETGAILLYLADKTGQFIPSDTRGRSAVIQWLIWQVAGLGPMLGQAYHFVRYAPEGQTYPIARYCGEALRLLRVLDRQLRDNEFVAGAYSVADMACWPWVQNISNIDYDLADLPGIKRWSDMISARPAVQRVVGSASIPANYLKKRMKLTPEQWSNLFGDKLFAATQVYD